MIFKKPINKYSASTIMVWLWHAWRGNRLQATLNACIGLAGVAVSLLTVWAMQRAIDIAAGNITGKGDTTTEDIYWAVGVMALLTLVEFALSISRIWIKNILGVKAQNRMQQQTMARLLHSEWRGREAMHSGDVINRLEQDVQTVVTFLTETIPSTLSTLAMFIGAFVYLFMMDTILAFITVGILPVFILASRFYVSRMRHLSRNVRDTDSRIQNILTETMQHRMLVKTMEADSLMLSRLGNTQQQLRQNVKRRTLFSVASNLAINTGFAVGYLIAFLWGALRLNRGTLTFGGMTAFLQLVYRIQGPARDLTKLAPAFVSVFTAAERLMELEEVPEEQQGESQWLKGACGLRFSDVSYNYGAPGQLPVIRHANYDFRPGSCTAILGETGSGKTTLIRLILALIRPTEGHIDIYSDNKNGSAEAQSASSTLTPLHRCNFVYVPQGNTLLSGTLRENMLLGREDATDEEMLKALHMACADFIDDLPDGLDTVFAEHGGGLSEGQAQRIAIARALLRRGSIMLFDEATSALDPDTERHLLENILSNHDKTVIFVTHRHAVVEYCDNVINFDK